ncbi:MAG: ABC transporter ATP-binding protein [Thermoguttaceae bacterium]
MKPVIRLDKVTKRFRGELALDNVSLEVPPGVVFALLGENGAGKTTAIRILLGLLEADAGQAEVLGLASDRQGLEIRRRVGYVAERPTLYDWMTVAETGWFAAGFYPDGFLTHYQQLVRQFELPGHRKLKTLSKGMRAKVALALAMAHDPDLLILDEPTSGLDTLVRRQFLESMVDRAAAGKTVFLSSHQIGEVERVADIVAILHDGKLVLVEPLDVLKSQICELTITLQGDSLDLPPIAGQLLSQHRRARQWQLLVRGLADDQLAALENHPAIQTVDARTPSLEEIFVAYMQRKPLTDAEDNGSLAVEVPAP